MSSLLIPLFVGAVAALPGNILGRSVLSRRGNPYNPTCAVDACANGVIAVALATPSVALDDCSAFLHQLPPVTSTSTSRSFVTANPPPVTVTVTQTLPTTFVSNVLTTETVTTTEKVTDYEVSISYITYLEGNIVEVDTTTTTTEVQTQTVTSTYTPTPTVVTVVPRGAKRDVLKAPKPKRGACRHHPESTTPSSASITASASSSDSTSSIEAPSTSSSDSASSNQSQSITSDPSSSTSSSASSDSASLSTSSITSSYPASSSTSTLSSAPSFPTFCADAAQYSSACACAYVTTAGPAATVNTIVTVTETVLSTDTVFATAYSSITQTSTITAFTTTTAETTVATVTETYEEGVVKEFTDYDYETETSTVASTTTTTVVVTAAASPTVCTQPQPTFHIQIASGTREGQFLYGGADWDGEWFPTLSLRATSGATAVFTIGYGGILRADSEGGPQVFYDATNSLAGRVVYSTFSMLYPVPQIASAPPLPLYASAGAGPGCPAATGRLYPTAGKNGAYDTWVLCDDRLILSVGGSAGDLCNGGRPETVVLNYIAVV
ncbi:hypothetical protein PG985_005327 [Apiospora marii]|uniref:uncharacterized protein n=1 Tax=Apiospora marii TaxID=335849 RepID=UPI0031300272